MNLLTMKNIRKAYTDKVLLSDVDFSVNDGEKIGIVGINGTGKSTLLRIITGEDTADSGDYARQNNLKLAALFQTPEYDPDCSLYDYVLAGNDEGKVQQMLAELIFPDYSLKMSALSEGQRKKAALARTLLADSDLLILDEPTNHLDQDVILWLEKYLIRYAGALVMVTHDRYFLDRVCNRIVEIDKGKLYSYQSNYSGFLETKAAREEMEAATFSKHQNILRKELAWVKRGAKARSTKQKARLDRYEVLKNEKAPETTGTVEMASAYSRMGKKTLELSGVSISYGDRKVFSDFSYIFLKNDRIGIVGNNGCGKTTLMNLIAGLKEPDDGCREVGTTLKIGYFAQTNVAMNPEEKVIDYIRDTAEYITVGGETITASAMLERFLFEGSIQYQKIAKLSGGEKRRLYLLKVLMEAPNVLLLDEPTNDLDIRTLAILEDYLDDFAGIVVTVSHDRYFLDRIAQRIFAFEAGTIRQYEGNYTDYLEARGGHEDMASTAATGRKAAKSSNGPTAKKENESAAGNGNGPIAKNGNEASIKSNGNHSASDGRTHEKKLKFSYNEQREYETIEDDIAALEDRIQAIDAEMLTCTTDFVRLNELSKEKEEKESLLDEKMERFLYLSDLAEEIAKQNEK